MLPSSLLFALHILIGLALTFRLLYRKLAVSTTLGWIIILFALPYIGIFFYFLFGDHRMGRKRLHQSAWVRNFYQKRYGIDDDGSAASALDVSDVFRALSESIGQDSGFHVTHNNSVEMLEDAGEIIDRLVADIDAATNTCYLEFYIVEPEGRVTAVMEAWEDSREHDVARVNQTLQDLRRADVIDLAMLSVATRHIRGLIEG